MPDNRIYEFVLVPKTKLTRFHKLNTYLYLRWSHFREYGAFPLSCGSYSQLVKVFTTKLRITVGRTERRGFGKDESFITSLWRIHIERD